MVASSTSTREEREEYGSMSSTGDSNFAMRFLGSQSAELAGVVPQLQQMFREKGLRWGSRLFFRQFKYPSAAAIARLAERTAERAARRERECYKIINVEKGWKGKGMLDKQGVCLLMLRCSGLPIFRQCGISRRRSSRFTEKPCFWISLISVF